MSGRKNNSVPAQTGSTQRLSLVIMSVISFIALVILIAAYASLAGVAFWIAALTSDRQGVLLCAGVGLSVGLNAFINISVVSGFCPTTGVTAPFLSYGGSSMIATMAGVGLLLSVSRVSEKKALAEELDLHFASEAVSG